MRFRKDFKEHSYLFLFFFFYPEMEIGEPKVFEVQTAGAGGRGDLDVEVTGPSGQPVDIKEKDSPKGKKITVVPDEEGE